MTLSASEVQVYVADPTDMEIALGAAAIAGISPSNIIGNFESTWNTISNNAALVIAAGGPSNTALYHNPCGWTNPIGEAAGHTPFAYASEPQDTLPGADYYENAAGNGGYATAKLVAMLAYYAVHGSYPSGYGSLPAPSAAGTTCEQRMSSNVSCNCY
ncbi:hypothetical protein [Alicyclobacillus sp. SO9]|uniref:hypothetical protein n=1 Tax=Alicyclobacillus sp. SO9 TaxID=2665646 RepID=UPI0018E8CEB5|nr:hypothetical protein [Alicyclobacillus sp. SO9]QQE78788.1 hypothetical protein GI364_23580 [Alicyclobacillus sp. SO9]